MDDYGNDKKRFDKQNESNHAFETFMETRKTFEQWEQLANPKLDWLNSRVETMKEVRKNVNISNLVGSSVSGVGGVLAIVGTALLPFTFGISSALIVSGVVVSVAGSTVVVGSNITEAVIAKKLSDEEINDFMKENVKLDELLNRLEKEFQDDDFLSSKNASKAKMINDIISSLSLLRSIGIVAGFVDDIARVATPVSLAAAKTVGVVVGSVAGGLGLAFDFANIGFTIHNMATKQNSSYKSEELDAIVQQIMRKRRWVNRILERCEMELFPGRFCLTCCTRIVDSNFVSCRADHNICADCFVENCSYKINDMEKLPVQSSSLQLFHFSFPCVASGCVFIYERNCCEKYLDADLIQQWDKVLYRRAIAEAKENIDLLIWCRYCSSPYQLQETHKKNDTLFRCKEPNCELSFCLNRECRVNPSGHESLSCEDALKKVSSEECARRILEEMITEIVVRRCSSCNREFQKFDGCNRVRCDCGMFMCYICRTSNITYSHFHHEHDEGCPEECSGCTLGTNPKPIDDACIMEILDDAENNNVPITVVNELRTRFLQIE